MTPEAPDATVLKQLQQLADRPEGRAIVFDGDAVTLSSLQVALPGWRIDELRGATVASLPGDWDTGSVDLLILSVRAEVTETLALCRFLSARPSLSAGPGQAAGTMAGPSASDQTQTERTNVPLLVLLAVGQEGLVAKAIEAGAHSCLMLPINAKEVASMVVRERAGNQPGRHTLNLERAQHEDRWRDDGGQG